MPPSSPPPSKGQVNRCGDFLVDLWHGGGASAATAPGIDENAAVDVLNWFRREHAQPMLSVRMSLQSFLNTTDVSGGNVTQRLKRRPRIIRKLHRMPGSLLARLEDVGGCRVVVPTAADLDKLQSHMRRKWAGSIRRERDYISDPKDIGYRAVHVVVERNDRRIEVQLRTVGQQQWADAVEAADSRHRLNLKDGTGPEEMVDYFEVAAEVIHLNENRLPIRRDLLERFQRARLKVVESGYYRS